MIAHSNQVKSIPELESKLNELKKGGFHPTLAIVFTSFYDQCEEIKSIFTDHDIALFGASSGVEFIDQDYDQNSIAVLLMDMPTSYFRIEIADVDNDNIYNTSFEIGRIGKETFTHPGFIISSADTELKVINITRGLVNACDQDTILFGGNSSTDRMGGGFIFSNHKQTYKGIIVIVIDTDKIEMVGEAISGWKPAGTAKTVTECDGNWVKTIDDQPALGSLMKYIGVDIDFSDKDDLYNKIGNIYPLQILHDDGTSYILPPLFFNEEEGSFMLAGPVKRGTKVKFSLPPDFDVVDTVIESAREKKNQYLEVTDAMIIFSCAGRLSCLGPLVSEEIKGLIDTWNVPSIGFFTFGEYGSVKNGKPMFHGTTVSWVALKEKGRPY